MEDGRAIEELVPQQRTSSSRPVDTRKVLATLKSSSRRMLAEFVIVFLGVYGAFWVEGYRDELETDERREQVLLALRQDLQDYILVSSGFNKEMTQGLAGWRAARDQGLAQAPYVFRIYGAETPPMTTWEVVTQAELARLLQPALLYELGFFYNEALGTGLRYVRYSEFTETEVLPVFEMDENEQIRTFYKEDQSGLRPRFASHMRRLEEYLAMTEGLVGWAKCLEQALAEEVPLATGCRGQTGVSSMSTL